MKDYLPVNTIKSFFSRRAKKIRTGQLKLGESRDDDDVDDIVFEDEEAENEEGEEDIDRSAEREKATTVIQHLVNNVPNLETDDWVAVAFPQGWYPGQFMQHDDESKEVYVNFLERTSSISQNFIWPALNSKEEDKSWVDEGIEAVSYTHLTLPTILLV